MSGCNLLWSERRKAAIKARAKILDAARSWFNRHNYIEVHGPVLIPSIGHHPNTFEVEYFDKKACLTQGLQPYAGVFASNFGRVYTIAPVFRAEKATTHRHLTEYWRIEAAISHSDLDTIMRVQEQLVSYICKSLSKEAQKELDILQCDAERLGRIRPPFRRLTYDTTIKTLQEDGFSVQWGSKLEWEHEKHLSLKFNQPFFISEFPVDIETYFLQSNPTKPELSLSVDLLAPEGYGEISTGGKPTIRKEELLRKMKEEEIGQAERKWYLDLREMGSLPYSGFAIGVERFAQWICELEHIKEAFAFPRSMDGIYP